MEHRGVARDVERARVGHAGLLVGGESGRAGRRPNRSTARCRAPEPRPDRTGRHRTAQNRIDSACPGTYVARTAGRGPDGSSGAHERRSTRPVGLRRAMLATCPPGRPPLPSADARNAGRRGASAIPVAAPVLVRQIRNGIVESQHRGDIVEVDAAGRIVRILGDPERVVTLRSTVKPFGSGGAHRGRRDRGLRPDVGRDRDHGLLPLGRRPARPDDPGAVPPGRRLADGARLRGRGHAPRRADRRPAGPRRGAAVAAPPHVLGPAFGLHPALAAARLAPRDVLARRPPGPRGVPERRRPGLRRPAGQPAHGDRRLRRPDLRVHADRGRPRLRPPRRPVRGAVRRSARRARART